MHANGLENQAIEIVSTALMTDDPSTFESKSAMNVVGYSMTKNCADKIFAEAGFAPGEGRDQVGVLELHDCFSANEARPFSSSRSSTSSHVFARSDLQLITYEALGLCAPGEAHKLVDRGDNTVCSCVIAPFRIPWLIRWLDSSTAVSMSLTRAAAWRPKGTRSERQA